MKISKRLRVISDFITDNSFILDIGCDHALLDIYTVLNKKNIKAIASDINEGPIKSAKDNIKKYDLEDKIKTKCSDGLEAYEEGIDTIVLSGLGATTIVEILSKGKDILNNIKRIIISSNNDYKYLRENLLELGYYIKDEKIVIDNSKYYPIILFEKGNKTYTKYELEYGPVLLNKMDDNFKNYLEYRKDKLISIKKALKTKHFMKKFEIKREIRFLNEKLKKRKK